MSVNKIDNGNFPIGNGIGLNKQEKAAPKGFKEVLENAISSVNDKLVYADDLTKKKAMGMEVDMAENMIAMQEADMSFRLLLQVRNKVITAHEELMRMQF